METQEASDSSRFATGAFPLLAALGLAVSLYLWYVHISGTTALCVGVGGCETVNASRYAELGGIPVASLGAFTYLGLVLGWFIRGRLFKNNRAWLALAIFVVTLIGVLFSAYLTYLELFVIYAICPWCVTSAVIITLLFIIAVYELRTVMTE